MSISQREIGDRIDEIMVILHVLLIKIYVIMNDSKFTRRVFLKRNLVAGAGLLVGSKLSSASNPDALINDSRNKLTLSLFDIDATPPIGTSMAYDSVINTWDLGLRAKGIVLHGAGDPIVLCAIDWIGIGDEGYDQFCSTIANAAGTIPQRVALHTVHQHDSYRCDFGAEKILIKNEVDPKSYDGSFARFFLLRLEKAIKESLDSKVDVTHVGLGEAAVYNVASTRRIIGDDGQVRATRFSSCTSEELRAEPEGVIDQTISLERIWNGD